MTQTLYGDVLFLVNFTMDYLTLYITSKILHRKIKPLRIAIASGIGALYGVASCFIEVLLIVGIAINIAISFVMCHIVFGKQGLLPSCAIFYGIGCLLGGAMTAAFSFIGSISGTRTVFVDGAYHTVPGDIPLGWMAVTAAITAVAAILGGQYVRKKRFAREISFSVNILGKTSSFIGICDSGNLLTEPTSGRPVIVLTKKALLSIAPTELFSLISLGDVTKIAELSPEHLKIVRLIPSETANGSSLLIGLIPDSVVINGVEKSAVIASGGSLSSFGGCEAIVPLSLCE